MFSLVAALLPAGGQIAGLLRLMLSRQYDGNEGNMPAIGPGDGNKYIAGSDGNYAVIVCYC
jgi:hypothetical protein